MLLEIKNLQAETDEQKILKGLDLKVAPGEIHAIMGPNGSGKSTLSKVLTAHPDYKVTGGEVLFEGEDLLAAEADERAHKGIFLGFQYPVELPGVNNLEFLRLAYNSRLESQGQPEISSEDFLSLAHEKIKLLDLNPDLYLSRSLNEGFSGGEKKRNEILQMALLEPKLAILDEIDSGLDIDALRSLAAGIKKILSPARSLLLITHYQRLLKYITPDYIHIMINGRIVRSGDRELALELEEHGYKNYLENVNA